MPCGMANCSVVVVVEPEAYARSDTRITVTICLTIAAIVPLLGIVFGLAAIWQSVRLLRLPGYSQSQRRAAHVTLPVAATLTALWVVWAVLAALAA
ncbi:MAG: hypothetical protein JWQ77_3940 [Jatrophihabitans sp.]|nr:hypothetical protein [Jatrophihabitans sp.]